MRRKTLVSWLIAISTAFVLSNGVVIGLFSNIPFLGVAGLICTAAAVLAIICLAEMTFFGNPRRLWELNTRGEVSYSVLSLMHNHSGCELLNIAEGRSSRGLLCAIQTNYIRGGADAIPRDGSLFKLVEGAGHDDIVVIKVPSQQEEKAARMPIPAK